MVFDFDVYIEKKTIEVLIFKFRIICGFVNSGLFVEFGSGFGFFSEVVSGFFYWIRFLRSDPDPGTTHPDLQPCSGH